MKIGIIGVEAYQVSQEPIQSLTCDGLDLFLVCKKYQVSQEPIQSLTIAWLYSARLYIEVSSQSRTNTIINRGNPISREDIRSEYRVSQEPIQSLTP